MRFFPVNPFLFFILFLISFSAQGQRVGIGTDNPQARLAVDSGIIVDQANSNNPSIAGRNVGLFFGNPSLAGITSSKQPGSSLRSGLFFWTNGQRRLIIDSLGQVGINAFPVSGSSLTVFGPSTFYNPTDFINDVTINDDLIVRDRIITNTTTSHDALLYLKGRASTPNNWGMHIIMEAPNTTDSAAIIYDGDMKMRVFGDNDNFVFRNSANSTLANINSSGDATITGNLTANGNGIVQSNSTSQMQIFMFTSPATLNWSIAPGASGNFLILFSGFIGTPIVVPGTWSNVTNESHLLVTATDVTATSANIIVRNVGSVTSVATNSNFRAAIIGLRN